MYLEDLIKEKKFFHYLNLYHYYNLKLLYNSIITDVPFLEVDESKMLSFNGSKEYVKGTVSKQLQEYVQRKNLIDYMEDRDKKFTSNNFYDKFFGWNQNNNTFFLQEYNKSISSSAFLGLYPFKLTPIETITNKVSLQEKQKIAFLLTCEIKPNGGIVLKAFNEKLLSEILGTIDKPYKLRFNYNIKNKSLVDVLEDLYSELLTALSNKSNHYQSVPKKNLIKEIDKVLTLINSKKSNKLYFYQVEDKINFLFYENENIVNNNLYDYYKNEYINKFIIKKSINNEETPTILNNTLDNKNILDLYFKLINKEFTSIGKNIIVKYKGKLLYLNNLENIHTEDMEDYVSIVYIINFILKRYSVPRFFSVFIVGQEEKLKEYGLDISNIYYDKPLSEYINIKMSKTNKVITSNKEKTENEVFEELMNTIDKMSNQEVEQIIEVINENEELYSHSNFKTYFPDYLKYLKQEKDKKDNVTQLHYKKSFTEWLMSLFMSKEELEEKEIIIINGFSYKKKILEEVSLEVSPAELLPHLLEAKENHYIDFSSFDVFSLNELKGLYLKSVLKGVYNAPIVNLYKDRTESLDFLFPIQFGKSNILIDLFKTYGNIDHIVVQKPDNIPLYYLFPMLYKSKYVFTIESDYKRTTTGYWTGYNPKILHAHTVFLKEKLFNFLKINNEYIKENEILQNLSEKINFSNFTNNSLLLSIKELKNKLNID